MEKNLYQIAENLTTCLKQAHINLNLTGWPAAVTAIAFCGSGVAIYAIKVAYDNRSEDTEKLRFVA